MKRILDTYELCESVLEHLPAADLLRIQSVCRSFNNNIITSSIKLKRNLFLMTTPASPDWVIDSRRRLLVDAEAASYCEDAQRRGESVYSTPVFGFNSLVLRSRFQENSTSSAYGLNRFVEDYIRKGPGCKSVFTLSPQLQKQLHTHSLDASCRTMFLSQPPAKKVSVLTLCGYEGHKYVVENHSGVTVGMVMNSIRQVVPQGYDVEVHVYFEEGFAISLEEKLAVGRNISWPGRD